MPSTLYPNTHINNWFSFFTFHCTGGYPTVLAYRVWTPDTKNTPSRTGACILVCAEPRCISQKRGCVETTDAGVASSLQFNSLLSLLTDRSSNCCTAFPEAVQFFRKECNFPKVSKTTLGLTSAIQFLGGNYHGEGVLREKNAAH